MIPYPVAFRILFQQWNQEPQILFYQLRDFPLRNGDICVLRGCDIGLAGSGGIGMGEDVGEKEAPEVPDGVVFRVGGEEGGEQREGVVGVVCGADGGKDA